MLAKAWPAFLFPLFAIPPVVAAADLPGSDADGWYAWQIAVVDSAPELCCFSWNDNALVKNHCNLDGRYGSVTSANDHPFLSDTIRIYAYLQSGNTTKIRTLSSQCPVTSNSVITDIGPIDTDSSVGWLQRYFSLRTDVSTDAIAAVALHDGDRARALLVDTALSDASEKNRESAIFWMAQARIDETADEIKKIMIDDRNAVIREHAAFSYSQSTASDRAEALILQGTSDPAAEVRSQAWFWLAQTEAAESEREIRRAIAADPDAEVREQAVFAMFQLPEDRATAALTDIVEDFRLDIDIRKQALFWLAQSDSDKAFAYVEQLLGED